jgi:hypothetical protein
VAEWSITKKCYADSHSQLSCWSNNWKEKLTLLTFWPFDIYLMGKHFSGLIDPIGRSCPLGTVKPIQLHFRQWLGEFQNRYRKFYCKKMPGSFLTMKELSREFLKTHLYECKLKFHPNCDIYLAKKTWSTTKRHVNHRGSLNAWMLVPKPIESGFYYYW